MDFPKLLHGFVKIDTRIALSFYMDLSKLLHEFVKVNLGISISCPLPNKTKLKFDQDFNACWSFELKVLKCQSVQCFGSVVPLAMFIIYIYIPNLAAWSPSAVNIIPSLGLLFPFYHLHYFMIHLFLLSFYIIFVSNPQCCEYNPQLGFVVSEAETSRALLSRPLAI